MNLHLPKSGRWLSIVVRASLLFACFVFCPSGIGQSFSTTLQLDTPSAPINVLDVELDAGVLGDDTDTATLSGTVEVTFDLVNNGSSYDITGTTLTGGTVSISDVSFGLAFGVSAETSGLAGTPFTGAPPGVVTGTSFDSAEHGVAVNAGVVQAAGSEIDFAEMPFVGLGQGIGSIELNPGTPVAGFEVFDVTVDLPVMFDEPFDIPGVPFIGTVTANFSGTGTVRSSGTLQIPIVSMGLACDFDMDGDCELNDIDAMYADIVAGTQGGAFDFDGDGTVTAADIGGWLESASDASNTALSDPADTLVVGDIDLNGDVDSTDLGLLLNNFGSANGAGWGGGDLNADLSVDSTDLGLLLNNFGHASLASAVPEPTGAAHWLVVMGCFLCLLRGRVAMARRRS